MKLLKHLYFKRWQLTEGAFQKGLWKRGGKRSKRGPLSGTC
jgi:hypothetical protein